MNTTMHLQITEDDGGMAIAAYNIPEDYSNADVRGCVEEAALGGDKVSQRIIQILSAINPCWIDMFWPKQEGKRLYLDQ